MTGNCTNFAVEDTREFDLAKLYSISFLNIGVPPGYFDAREGNAFLVSAPAYSLSNLTIIFSITPSF